MIQRMRVVSYNILDGGGGRADPLAEVILAQKPDVVVLVEAQHAEVLDRIASRLQMDCVQGLTRKSGGAAILSHWPIVDSVNHSLLAPGLERALLQATVRTPAGPLGVGAVHLSPRANEADEDQRMKEIEVVLQAFDADRRAGRPHLLAGDFNANAPRQRIDINKVKEATREAMVANGGDVPRRVVQRLLDCKYLDTLAVANGSAAFDAGSFTTQHPGQRVDYIFTFGFEPRQIRSAWIESDRLAKYASDHFPVGVELELQRT